MGNKDITRNMLNVIRECTNSKRLIVENEMYLGMGKDIMKKQEESFRSTVGVNVKFGGSNDSSSNPLTYDKETGNIILGGSVPSLNNLKFQFSLMDSDGNGCFIWCDGLRLSNENVTIIHKILGYYENWREDIMSDEELINFLKNSE